jgi:hypothetical protein
MRREWPPSRPRVSEGMRRPASAGRAQRLHRPNAPRCCGGAGGAPKPVVLADSPIGRRRRAQALDRAMRSGVSQISSTQKSSCWNGKANRSSVQSPMASLPNEPAPPNPRYERQHRRLLPTDVGDRGCPEPAAQAQRSGSKVPVTPASSIARSQRSAPGVQNGNPSLDKEGQQGYSPIKMIFVVYCDFGAIGALAPGSGAYAGLRRLGDELRCV